MEKNIIKSFVSSLYTSHEEGESYRRILYYVIPEYVTNLVVYSMPLILDLLFIGSLGSTAMTAGVGSTNIFLNLIVKIAESLSVGTVIFVGTHNGAGQYRKAGDTLRQSFWTTIIVGAVISSFLWVFAKEIYVWHGLKGDVVTLSVPFMKLRAISTFLMFASFAVLGFLRGIKNTQAPMIIFMAGMVTFILFDYTLIFGAFGLPCLGIQGSAYAAIIQHTVTLLASLFYVYYKVDKHKYAINLFSTKIDRGEVASLIRVSVPIMLDKSIMAFAYIWLCRMMAVAGTESVAAFCAVKEIERFAFIPAVACAQVITFLVSNALGAHTLDTVKTNVKRVLFIAMVCVALFLGTLALYPKMYIALFDRSGDYTNLASRAFSLLVPLVFFDVLQLILAGALRGAGDVRTVMITRAAICFGFFAPIAWCFAQTPIEDQFLKFILIYASFYIGSALMGCLYVYRFRTNRWRRALVEER